MSPTLDSMPNLASKYIDSGRYQLLHCVGSGSYGAVYRARERLPSTGLFVQRAIKVVPRIRKGRAFQAREIYLHQKIPHHPNVVNLHRAFQEGSHVFLVMDFLDGGDLRNHTQKKHTLARNDALIKNIFLQIVDGVEASHNAGVYHRDLKPENVLINTDMTRVCIADFGLATSSKQSISFNTGSRYYMSPECIDCDDELYPYDTIRSDIWALGVILLNMVTGHIPWMKATLDDKGFRSFLEEEKWLRHFFPISKGLNNILRRIFTIVPKDALSLAEIRREVRNLDSFYMSAVERATTASKDALFMWEWYAPSSSAHPAASTDSAGGFDSWTSSESDGSAPDDFDEDSDESKGMDLRTACAQLVRCAREGRALPPRSPATSSLPARAPAPVPVSVPVQSLSASSDEFPIRRPAACRAQLPPNSSSDVPSSNTDGPPITPETHAQDPAGVADSGAIEPFALDGPVLCHGKDSIREKNASHGGLDDPAYIRLSNMVRG
ncbi:kinase-like domain-containing protein [Trametes elegans]|nr:kinase-like domain-containing protein [Trametes elegans]